jgi:hypothetical protein
MSRAQLLMLVAKALRALRDREVVESEAGWKARQELCDELEAALLSAATNLRRQRKGDTA